MAKPPFADQRDRASTWADRVVRYVAEHSPKLNSAWGTALGVFGGALVALIDALSANAIFLMPLSVVVAVVAWLSTPLAAAVTVLFGSGLWSITSGLTRGFSPPGAELTAVLVRTLSLAVLAFFAHQLRRAIEDERQAAVHDPLTGLYNRRGFFELGEREFARARREVTPISVVVIDLDEFKAINDAHGHDAGDAALRRFAAHASARLRVTDVFARTGGDEFAIVLPATAEQAQSVVRAVIAVPDVPDQPPIKASAGVVTYPVAPDSLDAAVQAADDEMYVAKRRKLGLSAETVTPASYVERA